MPNPRPVNDRLRETILRFRVQAGFDAIDRGEFTEVDDADLDAALDGLSGGDANLTVARGGKIGVRP